MFLYALFAKVENDWYHDKNCSTFRIIVTTPGLCNTIFYDEAGRGNIHNGKVRLSKGNQIVGFEMHGITIDENAIHTKWNRLYANGKQVEVNGFKQSNYILHVGLKLMAYKSNVKKYYHSEDFIVKSFDDKHMCLLNDFDNSEINIELKLANHFKPMYAMTVHKSAGNDNK